MVQRNRLPLLLWGGLLSLLWCVPSLAQTTTSRKTIGAGDTIQLYVSSHKQLNKKYEINTQGQITLPFAGRVTLKGFTPSQAARYIQRQLTSHYRGLFGVKVVVESYRKFAWLRGWVRKPGRFKLGLDEGVGELLSKGGGPQPGAKLREIWIHSPGKAPLRFNLMKYYRSGKKAKAPALSRNSVVFVPLGRSSAGDTKTTYLRNKGTTIAVFGAVGSPGVYPLFYKINVLQALALARGPRTPSALQEIMIVEPNKPARWFDLRSHLMNKKKSPLPTLGPGSVLFVPTKAMGLSGRGPVRVMGRVGKPGIVRGTSYQDLSSLLASRGGPAGDANLSNINVVYSGTNFTISQRVDLKRALETGRMDRIPPTPPGPMVVHVPSNPQSSAALADTINVVQLVVSITSVITSTIVLIVTLNTTSNVNNNNNNTGTGNTTKQP
ncbi:MAG: hypothetical protein EP343_27945 [Deltaproteobacteria bacterium]|nr:MAG: hypothetical protein EP343_27945 [Deltaproteobacteria bacterium]